MDLSFASKRRRRSADASAAASSPDFAMLMAELAASALASPTGIAQASLSRDKANKAAEAPPQIVVFGRSSAETLAAGSFNQAVAGLLISQKEL